MRHLLPTLYIVFLIICPCSSCGYAETLISLYQASVLHFPTIESFKYIEQSLKNENKALRWQSILDVDVAANYYRLSTVESGKYSNGEFGVFNTFDIFNKKGVDRAINRYEIQKNKSLTDLEKKNIFTRVTEAYFTLLKNTRLLKIHEESLDWIEKNILLVDTGVEKRVFPAAEINRWTIEKLNVRIPSNPTKWKSPARKKPFVF